MLKNLSSKQLTLTGLALFIVAFSAIVLPQLLTPTFVQAPSSDESTPPESLVITAGPPIVTTFAGEEVEQFLQSNDPLAKVLRENPQIEAVSQQ